MEKIKIVVEKTDSTYTATAEQYPVKATGSDLKELKSNIAESLNNYFEEQKLEIKDRVLEFVLPEENNDSLSWQQAKKKLEKLRGGE